jgi:hypothetical protein
MQPKSVHDAGVGALGRLYEVAKRDSGQCRYIGRFLLGLYNGERFPFDLTDFRCIDDDLFEDCMRVLRMDARECRQEVHMYFDRGGERWESMADRWEVVDVFRLKSVANSVVSRGLANYEGSISKLVEQLKTVLWIREPIQGL